jgi:hypothetical protein
MPPLFLPMIAFVGEEICLQVPSSQPNQIFTPYFSAFTLFKTLSPFYEIIGIF